MTTTTGTIMKTWKDSVRHGLVSGTFASVLSTAALAACSKRENDSLFAPTNAVSHWLWGDQAMRHDEFHYKYTAPGYVIHHASATFWAVLFERFAGAALTREKPAATLKAALVTSAVACFADYQLTPRRLQPGYEQRLSTPSLFLVYAAFGIGLALGAHAIRRK
jgi:hypothetical protein